MRILLTIAFFLIFSISNLQSQSYSVGAAIGLGSFNGNFPSQTTFGSKLFLESPSPISVFQKLQFHFSYAQKLEKFLPGNYNYENYSYYTNLGVSGIFSQYLNENFKIEEGIGIIYLNDKSFDYINTWNWGILINVGIDSKISNKTNLFLNVDYGITLNNTTVNYIILLAGVKYKL